MKVTTISANLRFSKDIGNGSWKVIEIGADASVDPTENWQTAQAALYQQLGQQMTTLWNNGSSKAVSEPAKPDHYCREHQTPFKKHTKDGRSWWSHRQGNSWCRES